jgi:hypothetical protein
MSVRYWFALDLGGRNASKASKRNKDGEHCVVHGMSKKGLKMVHKQSRRYSYGSSFKQPSRESLLHQSSWIWLQKQRF